MVNIIVLKPFYDLKCHVDRNVGDTFTASEGRAEQICFALPGYISYEPVIDGKGDSTAKDVTTGDEPVADVSGMTVAQLKAYAREVGVSIPSGAKKAEIIAILKG